MFPWLLRVAALITTSACACAAAFAQEPGVSGVIPIQAWDELGFQQAGTVIGTDDYVQLRMVVYVAGQGNSVKLDKCPEAKLWDFDLKGLFRGNSTLQLGVQVVAPVIPISTFIPLKVERESAGFKKRCSVVLDVMRYRSPRYLARMYPNAQFNIHPTYTTTKLLDPVVQAALEKLSEAVVEASGVPAASAKIFLEPLSRGVPSTPVTNDVEVIRNLEIEPGKVRAPVEWVIPGDVLSAGKGQPPLTVVLAAQLVAIAYIIPPPPAGSPWQASSILGTAYKVPGVAVVGDGTLRSYLSTVANSEIERYMSANTTLEANAHCAAMASKIDALGLSNRDAALTLWALAKRRVEGGKSTDAEVDNMSCLKSRWDVLARVDLKPTPLIPPAKPGVPPSSRQMKVTMEVDDSAQAFFTSANWDERRRMAPALFQYPVAYSDPAALAMRGSASMESHDSWLVNSYDRTGETPVLAKFGCYTYFEGSAAHPFTEFAGQSVMLSFGETPAHGDQAAREVVVLMSFVPTVEGKDPHIDSVNVQDSISDETRAAARKIWGQSTHCRSGYRPRLLFGE